MNRLFKLLFAISFAAAPFTLMAQGNRPDPSRMPEGGPGEFNDRQAPKKMTAEQIAHQMTDRMDHLLTLTDKQYQKIYKLNLKEVKEMEADSVFMSRRGGFGGPMGPGFGPRPGMGPGGPGMRPPGMERSEGGRLSDEQMEQLRAEREKARIKKDKRLRKILTDEQYGIWVKSEQERLIRMREMRQRGPGQGGHHRHGMPDGGPGMGSRSDSTAAPRPVDPQ